jgi:hypothetical protein
MRRNAIHAAPSGVSDAVIVGDGSLGVTLASLSREDRRGETLYNWRN